MILYFVARTEVGMVTVCLVTVESKEKQQRPVFPGDGAPFVINTPKQN